MTDPMDYFHVNYWLPQEGRGVVDLNFSVIYPLFIQALFQEDQKAGLGLALEDRGTGPMKLGGRLIADASHYQPLPGEAMLWPRKEEWLPHLGEEGFLEDHLRPYLIRGIKSLVEELVYQRTEGQERTLALDKELFCQSLLGRLGQEEEVLVLDIDPGALVQEQVTPIQIFLQDSIDEDQGCRTAIPLDRAAWEEEIEAWDLEDLIGQASLDPDQEERLEAFYQGFLKPYLSFLLEDLLHGLFNGQGEEEERDFIHFRLQDLDQDFYLDLDQAAQDFFWALGQKDTGLFFLPSTPVKKGQDNFLTTRLARKGGPDVPANDLPYVDLGEKRWAYLWKEHGLDSGEADQDLEQKKWFFAQFVLDRELLAALETQLRGFL